MIDLTKLKSGTKILLDATDFAYEIKIKNGKQGKIEIVGGRFLKPKIAYLQGSHVVLKSGETMLAPRQIHKNSAIELFHESNNRHSSLFTGDVLTARITEKGGAWSYEVWGEKDITKSVKDAKNNHKAAAR